jgi:RsiW-degrading membrane proteinase PrsW (M82 family)
MEEYTWILLLLAFAPGIFWLWYFYHRDRYSHEPLLWILRIFLLGMLMTVPAALTENILAIVLSAFTISVIAAPVIEETLKYIVVRKTVYDTPDFNEPVDGIVYATAAALGFATLENLGYVLVSYETSLTIALQTGLLRAFLSVPAHALFSCMWGYALGHAKYYPKPGRGIMILKGFILAVVFHALFNFLLYYDYIGLAVLVLVLIPFMWWLVNKDIYKALREHYP